MERAWQSQRWAGFNHKVKELGDVHLMEAKVSYAIMLEDGSGEEN
jgi:hypothetical protein